MSEGTKRCPKCNGEMVQGFTCGREGPNRVVSAWFEGDAGEGRVAVPAGKGSSARQVRSGGGLSLFGVWIP